MPPDRWTVMALVVALLCLPRGKTAATNHGLANQGPPASPQHSSGPGRVVATITVLEGTVRMGGVDVELRSIDGNVVLAKTISDGAGQVTFPDVPPGRYVVQATRPGFVSTASAPFDVRGGETAQVLVDLHLTFVAPSVEVRAPISPTQSVQPVSTSDMLSGSVLDIAPLEGDDFQSLLPLLPGVVRGPDGRLRAKGGQPTQGALQISSASLIDPSSGDFDLELPGQSLESVEMLTNPFAAEHGRFSTSLVQIRTRRGTNDWEIKPGNLMPRLRKGLQRSARVRTTVLGPRPAQTRPAVPRAGCPVPLRQRSREEPARTNRRFGSRASIHLPASTACCRRDIRWAGSSCCSRARSSISR